MIILISVTILGYVAGVAWGLSTRENRVETISPCLQYEPPRPTRDESPVCIEYGEPITIKERAFWSFITHGLLGAFIGGWVGVIISLLEKSEKPKKS